MPDFEPTPAMARLANVLLAQDPAQTVRARCKVARISPKTYRALLADPDFARWLNGQARQQVADRLWQEWLEHLKLALEGNLQAIKLFYDRYDSGVAAGAHEDASGELLGLLRAAAETPVQDPDE